MLPTHSFYQCGFLCCEVLLVCHCLPGLRGWTCGAVFRSFTAKVPILVWTTGYQRPAHVLAALVLKGTLKMGAYPLLLFLQLFLQASVAPLQRLGCRLALGERVAQPRCFGLLQLRLRPCVLTVVAGGIAEKLWVWWDALVPAAPAAQTRCG